MSCIVDANIQIRLLYGAKISFTLFSQRYMGENKCNKGYSVRYIILL